MTNALVDLPQMPRFKAYTNYDNYVGAGAWAKISLNNTDYNGYCGFDAGTGLFKASIDGTYRLGAMLLYKINAIATARMRGRLVLNGTMDIRDLRSLLDCIRLMRRTAMQTAVRMIITGVMLALPSNSRFSARPRSSPSRQFTHQTEPVHVAGFFVSGGHHDHDPL